MYRLTTIFMPITKRYEKMQKKENLAHPREIQNEDEELDTNGVATRAVPHKKGKTFDPRQKV